jgi:hypothetical protein
MSKDQTVVVELGESQPKCNHNFRLEAMYPHHREVTEVADQLARCYCMMGEYKEAAQYLKACLPAIEERYF